MSDVKTSPPRKDQKCSKEGCKRPYRAKGYCVTHYKQWRQGALEGHKSRYKTCMKDACRKPRAGGTAFCEEHGKKSEAAA